MVRYTIFRASLQPCKVITEDIAVVKKYNLFPALPDGFVKEKKSCIRGLQQSCGKNHKKYELRPTNCGCSVLYENTLYCSLKTVIYFSRI